MLVAPEDLTAQQKFGPAISEAAEPSRCHARLGQSYPIISLV
jgi:hypothetical protein